MLVALPRFQMLRLLGVLLPTLVAGLNARSVISSCEAIENAVSSASEVYWPLSIEYAEDIEHWASSSTDLATCSVEPGTTDDLGTILQILGSNQTPFAVKGGGHATNPGFSSTTGVQIAMSRFSEVAYDATTQTVDVGAGLIWDDVYAALEPLGVNVVGGRVSGVGVAGFSLGGGYSWLTNQYGLTVDNIIAYQLVLPNGTAIVVDSSVPDLLFALKGGYNNFGIVTRFTFKAVPQGQVWGGLITFTENELDAVNAATANFAESVTDPKAQIITTYNFLLGEPGVSQLLFYNAPTPPDGIFDEFLDIPYFTKDISTRSFVSLVQASPSNITGGTRGVFNTVSILSYDANILTAVLNETVFWGSRLSLLDTAVFISYDVEPFMTTLFSKAPASSAAYPPSRAQGLLPLNIYFAWLLPTSDETMQQSAVLSAQQLTNAAVADGQDVADASLYGNYAIAGTPVERIFGDNLDQLTATKQKYDPSNVMGLAGGWKVPV
ncbi:hypothetical protein NM688_g4382 [Phlebia brevispora]|uniref:Uncharacterized protein n=1 Tax=Phlebia brevispora TaxID=194682 RepID=A0ACC1T336_9APHY|nr:hypothetical protein NM688_g4382 [Phlebia brevispora]